MASHNTLIEKLDLREKERLKKLEEHRRDKLDHYCGHENVDNFQLIFGSKLDEITNELNEEMSRDIAADKMDDLFLKIQELTKYLSDSTIFLNARVLEKSQEKLKVLQDQYQSCKNKYMPKKKFAFRKKTVAVRKIELPTNESIIDTTDSKFCLYESDYLVRGKCGKEIETQPSEVNGKDVCITDMEKCKVLVKGVPNTVHITNCTDSLICLGPVSTSVFLERCKNCTLKLACQQLRAHSSHNCYIYLHVSSRAIIEDCTEMYFGPFNWSYQGIKEDFYQAGLNIENINWTSIDDFNWLSKDLPSPNWHLLHDGDDRNIIVP